MFQITFKLTYFLTVLLCVTNGTQYLHYKQTLLCSFEKVNLFMFLDHDQKSALCVCLRLFLTYVFSIANQHTFVRHKSFTCHFYHIKAITASYQPSLIVDDFICSILLSLTYYIYIYIIFSIPNFI